MKLVAAREQTRLESDAFHQWFAPDGSTWASFHHCDAGYLIRFIDLADFRISSDGHEIHAIPTPGISLATLEHLCLNQVQPLAISRQGKLVLHASAVAVDDFAVAFVAASGQGKSTLATAFAVEGFEFLSDDGLQLENRNGHYLAHPSDPSIRLWEDSRTALLPSTVRMAPSIDYSEKARIIADQALPHCTTARPLRALYFLSDTVRDDVAFTQLPGQAVMMTIAKNCFVLDISADAVLRRHFSQLAELARHLPGFTLEYPRSYEFLPHLVRAVVHHARNISHA